MVAARDEDVSALRIHAHVIPAAGAADGVSLHDVWCCGIDRRSRAGMAGQQDEKRKKRCSHDRLQSE
jgi:hypothetical protein